MQTPFSVRPLLADERAILETGLRSASAFPLRRCQILRARAAGQVTTTMAHDLRCGRHRPRPHTIATIGAAGTCEAWRALCPQSPRTGGTPTSRWTLPWAAEGRCAHGLTPRLVSDAAMRGALHRWGVPWQRAQHGSTSPAPAYRRKKKT